MPIEVLVGSIDWDRGRIAGVAVESSVELLKTQIKGGRETARRIGVLFGKAENHPLDELHIKDSEGGDMLIFVPPVDFEILPDGDEIVVARSPEARLKVSPAVFEREGDTFYTRNKWEILRRTMGELADAFHLRNDPGTLEVVFPIRDYARGVNISRAVVL